jgi:tetratricopeptide (TPR) repeat protein
MQPMLKRLTAACAGALLLACADPASRLPLAARAGASAQAANDAYAAARRHHLAGRLAEAEALYRVALAAEPDHVNARNGLAALYAQRGDFARALPIWQALTANATLASGPGMAYLFNNLGYAYFLNSEYDKAITALEKACLLDPLNHRAWLHLGHALHRIGQDDRARQMFSQANALQQHDARSDYVALGHGAGVPAIAAAVQAPAREAPQVTAQEFAHEWAVREWGAADVLVGGGGMLALRRIPAVHAPVAQGRPPMVPSAAPASRDDTAMLEIRNGNGVTGMAKALSRQMAEPGLKVVRLSNEKGYNVRQTRIEYQGPFRAAAERLAERFDGARAVKVDSIEAADMRLVIGRDLVRTRFALRPPPAPAPKLASAAQADKTG